MAPRRLRVRMEALIDVVDVVELRDAACRLIDEIEFSETPGDDPNPADEAKAAVRASLIESALWTMDPASAVDGVPGVELHETSIEATELDAEGRPPSDQEPDFAALFPVCTCGEPNCEACEDWQLTPRTSWALWNAAQLLADQAYDDIDNHGDEPMNGDGAWIVFDLFPSITWRQDAVWRRQAARAFDDLAADLAAGQQPLPRNFGEEMALHLIIDDAATGVRDGWLVEPAGLDEQPPHPDDYDWDLLREVLFQDHDILTLFDPAFDGIEDPESEINERLRMGDMRPEAWFVPFNNAAPRDGRRPFRR